VAAWIDDYNTSRRHSAAQMMSPVTYETHTARQKASDRPAEAATPPPSADIPHNPALQPQRHRAPQHDNRKITYREVPTV
jgi:hypothetical protein